MNELEIRQVDAGLMEQLGALFDTDAAATGCWCMWFLVPVKQYHAEGPTGNRAAFGELMAAAAEPVGLMALRGGEAVGWCAVGPRTRYVRAIRTPTYKGRDPSEDDSVWLVPCFFIRPGLRRQGISGALLDAAIAVARRHGATAIEGFPLSAKGKSSGGDSQMGPESLFASRGFAPLRRPSPNRVVMRLEFAGQR